MKLITKGLQQLREVFKSSLFRSSGIYTISSFANASIPFLLLVPLTKVLSPADFGVVSMFTTVASFLMPFVGLNMEGAIARKFYSDGEGFPKYVGNCLIISLVSMLITLAICFTFANVLFSYTSIPPRFILLAVLMCFSQFVGLILLTIFQVNFKPVSYGLYQISQSFLNLGLSLILVLHFSMNWNGRIFAQIITAGLFALVALTILIKKKYVVFEINKDYIKHALKFGGGLIPHALGGLLIILTNRFFLLNMVSVNETGIYGVAAQVGSVIGFFTVSFNNAFVPWLYTNLKQNDDEIKLKIVRLTYLYFISITLMGMVFYLFSPLLFKWFINPNFHDSIKYVVWIILGFIFQGMYFMVTNYISYSEKTHYQAFVTLFVGVVNIPLNYFLIKFLGSIGASVAFASCFFLLFTFTWILSHKVYKMPWTLKILKH